MVINSRDREEKPINLFTIGFTGKTAEEFFETLRSAGVRRLVDVRLNNVSQLAGFAKKKDLQYFLRVIGSIGYVHELSLAPTQEILKDYQKKRIDWVQYERYFSELLLSTFTLMVLNCANGCEDEVWRVIVSIEEILGGSKERLHRLEYLTMRHFTTELFPEPLNRIKPGTVGGQI